MLEGKYNVAENDANTGQLVELKMREYNLVYHMQEFYQKSDFAAFDRMNMELEKVLAEIRKIILKPK